MITDTRRLIPRGMCAKSSESLHDRGVNNEIETLATALYVKIDDMLKDWPDLALPRPAAGIAPTLGDAELLTLAVLSAIPRVNSERRWLRRVHVKLAVLFPRPIGPFPDKQRVRRAAPLAMPGLQTL